MDIKKQLQDLYFKHSEDLGEYAWLYESDRWLELVFCLINQCVDQNPNVTREAAEMLQNLNLLESENMIYLDKTEDERAVTARYIFKAYGFSEKEASQAAGILARIAKTVNSDYRGKIQFYLRKHGAAMREELLKAIGGEFMEEHKLRYALSHWLQNTLSMPISMEHQAVLDFCKANKVSLEDLLGQADDLDLNIALIDDLLDIEHQTEMPDDNS